MNPLVSVVIPVHNTLPYLHKTLNSCLAQSIDSREIEVVAVDDGSTDGSGEVLDHFAAIYPGTLKTVHVPATGSPAEPRNIGLGIARGRYVYFLDGDDFLGTEALERMTGFADRHGSDVVLGKVEGRNGRHADGFVYRGDLPSVDLYESDVYWHIEATKLFRRAFLVANHIRFPSDVALGEDQPFTFLAYHRASKISVVSSYTCMYTVLRSDRSNLTLGARWSVAQHCELRLRLLSIMTDLVGRNVSEGHRSDRLLLRHWAYEGRGALRKIGQLPDRDDQVEYLSSMRSILLKWYTDGVASRLCHELASVYGKVIDRDFIGAVQTIPAIPWGGLPLRPESMDAKSDRPATTLTNQTRGEAR